MLHHLFTNELPKAYGAGPLVEAPIEVPSLVLHCRVCPTENSQAMCCEPPLQALVHPKQIHVLQAKKVKLSERISFMNPFFLGSGEKEEAKAQNRSV